MWRWSNSESFLNTKYSLGFKLPPMEAGAIGGNFCDDDTLGWKPKKRILIGHKRRLFRNLMQIHGIPTQVLPMWWRHELDGAWISMYCFLFFTDKSTCDFWSGSNMIFAPTASEKHDWSLGSLLIIAVFEFRKSYRNRHW